MHGLCAEFDSAILAPRRCRHVKVAAWIFEQAPYFVGESYSASDIIFVQTAPFIIASVCDQQQLRAFVLSDRRGKFVCQRRCDPCRFRCEHVQLLSEHVDRTGFVTPLPNIGETAVESDPGIADAADAAAPVDTIQALRELSLSGKYGTLPPDLLLYNGARPGYPYPLSFNDSEAMDR